MDILSWWLPQGPKLPTPPPLPQYDPNEDVPKWWWGRMLFGAPLEKTEPWPKIGDQPAGDDKPDWRGVIKNNVIPLPDPGPYTHGPPIDRNYFFFDTPDYADPFKKLNSASKIMFTASSGWAITWALAMRWPFDMEHHIMMFKKWLIPVYLSGMAASATAIAVANLRGNKDDYINWLAAGIVGGTVFGNKNWVKWFRAQLFCIPAALVVKRQNEQNRVIVPTANQRLPFYYISGAPADNGWRSGDFRFGISGRIDDPGREQRRYAL